MLSERGIADRVGFPGALAAAELADRYERTDLLVLPSRAETYGMVVTEALARGIPVLATNTGGLPEALGGDGVRPGLLVPPDDPAALAAALRRWLTEPGLRARLRSAARTRRATLYRWDVTAQSFAAALSALDTEAEVHSG
jgi:glycosyltransferase involved in cell wall biosynthesis